MSDIGNGLVRLVRKINASIIRVYEIIANHKSRNHREEAFTIGYLNLRGMVDL
jgi:hypothetical protein